MKKNNLLNYKQVLMGASLILLAGFFSCNNSGSTTSSTDLDSGRTKDNSMSTSTDNASGQSDHLKEGVNNNSNGSGNIGSNNNSSGAVTSTDNSSNNSMSSDTAFMQKAAEISMEEIKLGKLAQQKLMIVGSGFELSRELRDREEGALIARGIAAFRSKALTASRAFGFANFTLREVNLGSISGDARPIQPKAFSLRGAAVSAADAEPMAIEGGKVTLTLTVNGSVVMSQ